MQQTKKVQEWPCGSKQILFILIQIGDIDRVHVDDVDLLKNLALMGFGKLDVIDMDTIDISNLNRQFLFRPADVGRSKAEVAAEFIRRRIPGTVVTAHNCRIQDKDESFYRDLHAGYRKHFDRQGAPEGTVGVAGENESVVQAGLARYKALDVIVVRALTSATIENMSALAEAAGPAD